VDPAASRAWLWQWARRQWDPATGFVFNPPGGYVELGSLAGRHLVRESAWFALAALDHGEPVIACRALGAVLARQYDRPGAAWHGTFPVFAHDPEPGPDAIEWYSYDPNWRQFVGLALALILEHHVDALPSDVRERCEHGVITCVDGEPAGRIAPSYTNPALMHAWLSRWVGQRFGLHEYSARGDELATALVARFRTNGTVDEFNAPTYYGVDLVAAALWFRVDDPVWSDAGRALVGALLDELRFLYHPRLHNLCGPFTRAYTLDLASSVTLYGLWRFVARGDAGALPPLTGAIPHSHDLFFAPLIEAARRSSPPVFPADDDALPRERTFRLGGGRHATASLGSDAMAGAEEGGGRGDQVWDQYLPATLHCREGDAVRWVAVRGQPDCPVDCLVDGPNALTVQPAASATRPIVLATSAALEQTTRHAVRAGFRLVVSSDGPLRLDVTWDGRPLVRATDPTQGCRVAAA
jgi:hypothetical protein